MRKILISCSMLILLSGCIQDTSPATLETSTKNSGELPKEYNKKIALLEKTVPKEESYFFQTKEFKIYLPYAVDFIDISKIELFSGRNLVAEIPNKESIQLQDKHILVLQANKQINHFDTVTLTDAHNNHIEIPVGDYYYEGKTSDDTIPNDKEAFIRSKHYKQAKGSLVYTIEFTKVEGADIQFSVPASIQKIASLEEKKTISETADTITYEFRIDIPKEYFIDQDITNLNLELKAEQINHSLRKTIFKAFIPVNIDEYNTKAP